MKPKNQFVFGILWALACSVGTMAQPSDNLVLEDEGHGFVKKQNADAQF